MEKTNFSVWIVDLKPLLHSVKPKIVEIFEENNYDKSLVPNCIHWCVNEALFNVLLLSVINEDKRPEYEVTYSRLRFLFETHMRTFATLQDCMVFQENTVETFINNQDLYITLYSYELFF